MSDTDAESAPALSHSVSSRESSPTDSQYASSEAETTPPFELSLSTRRGIEYPCVSPLSQAKELVTLGGAIESLMTAKPDLDTLNPQFSDMELIPYRHPGEDHPQEGMYIWDQFQSCSYINGEPEGGTFRVPAVSLSSVRAKPKLTALLVRVQCARACLHKGRSDDPPPGTIGLVIPNSRWSEIFLLAKAQGPPESVIHQDHFAKEKMLDLEPSLISLQSEVELVESPGHSVDENCTVDDVEVEVMVLLPTRPRRVG